MLDAEQIARMTPDQRSKALAVLRAVAAHRRAENRLSFYEPYPKQRAFHAQGANKRERLFRAGNQLGKTWAGGFECAMHLTGRYPSWWTGMRFDGPIRMWAAGLTNESTRDNPQRVLIGQPDQEAEWGTGALPRDALLGWARAPGVPNLLDSVQVRHVSGGVSSLGFKSYEKGAAKWQGPTLHLVWFDEEPPEDIYTEGLTRTNATSGGVIVTFTPLLGMSAVVMKFLKERSDSRGDTVMTIEDVLHYTPEKRAEIIASYPAHQREARSKGIPTLGSGRIFPVMEEAITEKQPVIPAHWPRIVGLDIGWDHPTAAVWCAWDRDADCVHVYDAYRVREQTPAVHGPVLMARGKWIPVAWPHDGLQHDKGSGEAIAEQYRKLGVNMLADRTTFEDGGNGVEAGLWEMLDRMNTGRLKVAAHLEDWFEEFRLYHRSDKGMVVKEIDDLISATRYAIMSLRHACTEPAKKSLAVRRGTVA